MRRVFDLVACRYDFFNRVLSLGMDRRWRRRLARLAVARRPALVLDLCAGTGDTAIAVALAAGQSARVVALDFSEPMSLLAVGKCRRSGLSRRVSVVTGDVLALPFADSSFDAATVAFGLRNLASVDSGLAEVRRVLRPGGSLAVLEFVRQPAGPIAVAAALYRAHVMPWVVGVLRGEADSYRYLAATVDAFDSHVELRQRLAAHGFEPLVEAHLLLGGASLILAARRETPG